MSQPKVFWAVTASLLCLAACGGPDKPVGSIDQSQREAALRTLLESQFDEVRSLSEGRVAVRRGVNWAYVDEAGQLITKFVFSGADEFSEGLAAVEVDSKKGFIDKSGKFAISPRFLSAGPFRDGLADAQEAGGKAGYIDHTGAFVIAPQFDIALMFSEGFAAVEQRDKWGFINTAGTFIVRPSFVSARSFSEGLAEVEVGSLYVKDLDNDKPNRWGFIDGTGKLAIPARFDDVWLGFTDGSIPAKVGSKWGYIDKSGEFFIKPRFDAAQPFVDGIAKVQTGTGAFAESGCINKSGEGVQCPQ